MIDERANILSFLVSQIINKLLALCEYFTSKRHWQIYTIVLCVLFSILTSFPDYEFFFGFSNPNVTFLWDAINMQIKNPFAPISINFNQLSADILTGPASHLDKRTFRLTVPLIAYIFGLNHLGCIILQHFLNIVFFGIILKLSHEITKDKVTAFLITFSFACIFTGKWGFVDLLLFFDSFAFFFLAISLLTKRGYLITLFIFLASFTDERALIASSLVFVWWRLKETNFDNFSWMSIFKVRRNSLSVVIAWVLYFIVRFSLATIYKLEAGTSGIGFSALRYNFKFIPMGFYLNLEGFWVIIICAMLITLHSKNYVFAFILSTCIFLIHFVAFLVYDVSRSTSYAFPAIFISLHILYRYEDELKLRKLLLLVCLACFLFPTHIIVVDGIFWLSPILPKVLKLLTS